MVGVVALVREGCATWAPAFRLLVLAPVGGAIYVLALFVLARGTVDKLVNLARQRVPWRPPRILWSHVGPGGVAHAFSVSVLFTNPSRRS